MAEKSTIELQYLQGSLGRDLTPTYYLFFQLFAAFSSQPSWQGGCYCKEGQSINVARRHIARWNVGIDD